MSTCSDAAKDLFLASGVIPRLHIESLIHPFAAVAVSLVLLFAMHWTAGTFSLVCECTCNLLFADASLDIGLQG